MIHVRTQRKKSRFAVPGILPGTAFCFCLILSLAKASSAEASGSRAPEIAFTASQLWGVGPGEETQRLGVRFQTVYVSSPSSPHWAALPIGKVCCLGEAGLSDAGDLVAYTMYPGDLKLSGADRTGSGTFVKDLRGREIASIPEAKSFRWSPNGSRLALIYRHFDPSWKPVTDSIGVWDRSKNRVRTYDRKPFEIYWKDEDTLLLGFPEEVLTLSVPTSEITPTTYHGADRSPDGLYSIRREWDWNRFHLTEEASGMEVADCVITLAGPLTSCILVQPFWAVTSNPGHALCVSQCGECFRDTAQSHCVTALVDPRTLRVWQSIPGKAIGPTPDRRGVVVLRGDTLATVAFAPVPEEEARPKARVQVRVTESGSWGRTVDRPAGTHVYEVAEGDWLPREDTVGLCDKFFHVEKVEGGRVLVSYPAKAFVANGPDGSPIPGGMAEIGTSETWFVQYASDASTSVFLSLLP